MDGYSGYHTSGRKAMYVRGPSMSPRFYEDERQTTTGNEHAVILQEDVMRLQMELNKTMEQYESARCQVDALESEKSAMKHLCESLSETVMRHQTALEEKDTALRHLHHTVLTLENELSCSRQGAEELDRRLSETNSTKFDQLKHLQHELNGSKEQVFELRTHLSNASDEALSHKTRAEKLAVECEGLAHTERELRAQLASSLSQRDLANNQVSALKMQVDALKNECQGLENGTAHQKAEISRLRARGESLAETSSRQNVHIRELQEELLSVKDDKDKLERDSRSEIQEKSDNILAANKEVARVRDELMQLRLTNSDLQDRVWQFEEDSQNQSEEILRVKAVTAQRSSRQRAIEQQLQEMESLHKTGTIKLQRAMQHKLTLFDAVLHNKRSLLTSGMFADWVIAKRKLKRTRSAIMKILKRFLAAAFAGFVAAVLRSKEHRRVLSGMLRRMQNRTLGAALNSWADHVGEAHEMRNKLRRAAMKMWNGAMSHAFARWIEHLGEERAMRTTALKVLGKFMNSTQSRALARWVQHVGEERVMRAKALKVVGKFMNSTQSRALARWVEHVQEESTLKLKARKVLGRWRQRFFAMCFDRWLERIAEEKALKNKLLRVVERMVNKVLVLAVERWRDVSVAMRRREDIMLRVVSKMSRRSLDRAMERWIEMSGELKLMRQMALKVVQHMVQRVLSKALSTWVAFPKRKMRFNRILRRWLLRAAAKALTTWRAVRRRSVALRRVVVKWTRSASAKSLNSWIEFVRRTKRHRKISNGCIAKWRFGLLAFTWFHLVEQVQIQVQQKRAARKIVARALFFRKAAPFDTWRGSLSIVKPPTPKELQEEKSKRIAHRWSALLAGVAMVGVQEASMKILEDMKAGLFAPVQSEDTSVSAFLCQDYTLEEGAPGPLAGGSGIRIHFW